MIGTKQYSEKIENYKNTNCPVTVLPIFFLNYSKNNCYHYSKFKCIFKLKCLRYGFVFLSVSSYSYHSK